MKPVSDYGIVSRPMFLGRFDLGSEMKYLCSQVILEGLNTSCVMVF